MGVQFLGWYIKAFRTASNDFPLSRIGNSDGASSPARGLAPALFERRSGRDLFSPRQ
jgi:hypothetical protein